MPAPVSAMMRFFAHAPRQQDLADAVVDLVCAGVVQLFTLEVDLGAAAVFGQALGEVERAWATDIVALKVGQFLNEGRIFLRHLVFTSQIKDQRHQGLGHIAAAECTEQAVGVGAAAQVERGRRLGHRALQANALKDYEVHSTPDIPQ